MDVKQVARELHQLMQAAKYYLDLAAARINGREKIQLKDVAERFSPDHIPTIEDHERLYLGADLGSAAVRLWTIDERTDKEHWNKVESYFSGSAIPTENLVNHALNGAWLHGMLADNVGHIETLTMNSTKDEKVRAGRRRIDRQNVLGELTFGQVYDVLKRTASIRERHIKKFAALKAGSVRDLADLAQNENCCVCLARDGKMTPSCSTFAMGSGEQLVSASFCNHHETELGSMKRPVWSITKDLLRSWLDAGCPPPAEFFEGSE